MGNNMEKGEDYVDAFAPVPRATAARILLSIAEDMPQVFIRPPSGWQEEPGVVYEVLRPLYGIPSSARALHFTLDKWLLSRFEGTDEGEVKEYLGCSIDRNRESFIPCDDDAPGPRLRVCRAVEVRPSSGRSSPTVGRLTSLT
mmetsp:Transcript_63863/g.133024  ORF Transcript_63863/g.133024 Transcript_63863/m.133024 type:complete len:143 (-) Transcript_63863:158-586(-)